MAANRMALPRKFRAEGAVIPWMSIGDAFLRSGRQWNIEPKSLQEMLRDATRRSGEVQLRWACGDELGIPFEPFTVWTRPRKDDLRKITPSNWTSATGRTYLWWGFDAACVEVHCTVVDGSRPVALTVHQDSSAIEHMVGIDARPASGVNGAPVTLRVRCAGGNRAVLVNATNPTVSVESLDDVINDPTWKEIEVVGLPVDDPYGSTAYDSSRSQGLVANPLPPVDAAIDRLIRGGPPIGWSPVTQTGRAAPPWAAPDPKLLVEEVRQDVLSRTEAIFAAGVTPIDQRTILQRDVVASPQQRGVSSSLLTTAEYGPLSVLLLPAVSDPFLALAIGFGTAYGLHELGDAGPGRLDFLVSATWSETPLRIGKVELAAYVPSPAVHHSLTPPMSMTAARAGLVQPERRDDPWRESVKVSWHRQQASASLGRPSGAAFGRFDPSAGITVEPLLPTRASGGWRPLVPMPDGIEGTPGYALAALVERDAIIPLGSGGRSCGYTVALQDVFGIWSPWEDELYSGVEPNRPMPRVISLALSSTFEGSTLCSAVLETEVSIDWEDRTPAGFDIASVFFPMTNAAAPPPAGVVPSGVAPAGCFRRDMAFTFSGDVPVPPGGVTVACLDTTGENVVAPGPLQGGQGRRYRISAPVPTLDFGTRTRWGIQLWIRTSLVALPGPGLFSPQPAHPALANAGSPVPAAPLPLPLPPGVPIGSTPDAQGKSHARVAWSLPSGADVKKIIVWEVAETALRQTAGLPPRAAEGTLPGVRLQTMWTAYDAMTSAKRRSMFRRIEEITDPGARRDTDVALPRGSTDVHLFIVTTSTSTAVDSPWPEGPTPHLHLQAVMAPRLRRPAAPMVRPEVGAGGAVTLRLESRSLVAVASFRIYRTRSAVAARSFETMGPAVATVVASASSSAPDPATRELTYTATATIAFPPSWDDWFVRVVAVAVDTVPTEAVRGMPSVPSEALPVSVVPDAAPDLAPLSPSIWGTGHDGLLVTTSTSAPMRAVALGSQRISGTANGELVAMTTLEAIPAGSTSPPSGAGATPILQRGERVGGRTPLMLWFTRPVAANPADVMLQLVDPLGRVMTQVVTVPGWVAPTPPSLQIVRMRTIPGRGTIFTLRSDAPIEQRFEMTALATPLYLPWRRGIGGPFPIRPRVVRETWALADIPESLSPFRPMDVLGVQRTNSAAPYTYRLWVGLQPEFSLRVIVGEPGGPSAQVTTSVS